MNALTRNPQNTDYLQPTKYLLTFDRINTITYFGQTVNIPGVSIGQATFNTPLLDVYAPGNKITYNQFNIDFLVDEKLVGWQELYAWFRSIASPVSFDERNNLSQQQAQYASIKQASYSDATLTILSALNNPILRVKFVNMFPIALSDINFDTKSSADDMITSTATFVYDYFTFENA
jgi:hypothetical protein